MWELHALVLFLSRVSPCSTSLCQISAVLCSSCHTWCQITGGKGQKETLDIWSEWLHWAALKHLYMWFRCGSSLICKHGSHVGFEVCHMYSSSFWSDLPVVWISVHISSFHRCLCQSQDFPCWRKKSPTPASSRTAAVPPFSRKLGSPATLLTPAEYPWCFQDRVSAF